MYSQERLPMPQIKPHEQTKKWNQSDDMEASLEYKDENTQNHRIADVTQDL